MAEFADVSPWILWPVAVVLYTAAGTATAGVVNRTWPGWTSDSFAVVMTAFTWPFFAAALFLAPMCRALYRITSGENRE